MTARRTILAILLLVSSALPVRSGELAQPLAAREWVTLRAISRMGAYAEVCGKRMADTRPAWQRALADINGTVDRLAGELLATPRFAGLDKASVAAEPAAQLRRSVDGARSRLMTRLESQDPDAHCLQFLRNAQGFDDEALRPIVLEALAGFQAKTQVPSGRHPR